jgi:serine/threonine-protein kinase
MILGTAAYMAPEQARGKAVDRRADIWAFGAVLYEMLTGRRLFPGSDISDVLAAVLRQDMEWTALPPGTPPRVRRLLERCLDRDARSRLRDIGEARVEIAKTEAGAPESGSVVNAPETAPRRPASRIAPMVVTAVVVAMATYGLTRWLASGETSSGGGVLRVTIPLPDGDELGAPNLGPVAIAADDSRIAYAGLRDGTTQIFVRAFGERNAKALDGTEGGQTPFFSPDGQWIGFFAAGKLRKIAVGGTALQSLADAPFERGGDWADDGYIYFTPNNLGAIWRVPEGGGAATEVTQRDTGAGEISHRWPHVVAGGGPLLFSDWSGPGNDEQNIAMQAMGQTSHRLLVKGGNAPHYAAKAGLLLYAHIGELVAVPWRPSQTDLGRAVPISMPERVNDFGGNEGTGNYALSASGTLAYLAGGRSRNARRLVWVDRGGTIEPASLPERDYENVLFAPDGNRAVVQIRDKTTDLWIFDVGRNTLTPIGNSAGSSQSPVWSADGARIIYRATQSGFRNVFWRPADGSGSEERLTTNADAIDSPTSVSPDGHWLLFNENSARETGGVGIWLMRLDGDRRPRHLFETSAGESDGQVSPDGKWVAFQAPVSSRQEVYVSPFPGPGPRRQISTDGGVEPLWSSDGRELFFQSGSKLMAAGVTTGATFSAGVPRVLHEGRFLSSINGNTDWTLTRDGKRFLRIQQVEPERAVTRIDLVLNFLSELKQLTAAK